MLLIFHIVVIEFNNKLEIRFSTCYGHFTEPGKKKIQERAKILL